MPLKVWLASLDAWASQYPDADKTEPPTRAEWDEHLASLSDAERRALGLIPNA